ncbi:unnamed protein product [Miscanthus lutarioriparius]|uniref:Uncharacterized protein n=1 Tax=Miscanthus lutarioriparius TaxID=422564 RepID=A0A811RSC0_9POAL|nr:unnamed protein product [Miscanthus lutarioriparius]
MEAAAPADAGTAFESDDRPPAPRVSKLARAPRRSRSEKMGPRVLQLRRAASPPPTPELRRSESENGRRRSSVSARDARACGWGGARTSSGARWRRSSTSTSGSTARSP